MHIPRIMRAVLLEGHGGLDQLRYRTDVPVPVPAPGEVLIAVGAAAINNTDVNTRIGWYSKSVATATGAAATQGASDTRDASWSGSAFVFPRIQGTDVCGRIVAVGAGIGLSRVGERVLVDPVLRPADGSLAGVGYVGLERDGGFAEFVTVPAANAHRVVCMLSDTELATFPCAYGTAENLLTRSHVGPGETVLVTGASGGVGSAVVQLASQRGARVIAVTTTTKAADVQALGARSVVERDADVVKALGRESVDVVVDVVGGSAFAGLLEVLVRGGRYAVAGAIAGPVVPLDLRTLYLKDLQLLGCTVTPPEVFARLVDLVQRGALRPVVSATYPLADIVAAQSDFLRKARTGKIVLLP